MALQPGNMQGMTIPPSHPPAGGVPRRLLRMLLRGTAVAALVALAGLLERHLDPVSLQRVAFAAGVGAAAGFLVIGAGFVRRSDEVASRALDWLLLGPWTVLFVLGLWWLEGLLDAGPLRALLAAAAATLGSVVLTVLGALLPPRAAP